MNRKFAIIGVIFALAGAAGFGWAVLDRDKGPSPVTGDFPNYDPDRLVRDYNNYTGEKTETQQHREQQERLKADLRQLAAQEKPNARFADLLYGKGWGQTVKKYKAQKELKELVFTTSILSLSAGGLIFV